MSITLFREVLNQEVINLIKVGCDPISVYEYAYHKAEGAAFFAMLNGVDGHAEITKLSSAFGRLVAQEKQRIQSVSDVVIA